MISFPSKWKPVVKKIVLLLIVAVTFFVGYLFLFQPHITFKEVRISSKPDEIVAVYVNITGNPSCAKLYRLERMENGKPVASDDPIFLTMPKDLPSPEDGKLACTDNVFHMKGYGYQFEQHNKLTGHSRITPSNRFDVVAWEVITPYKIRKDSVSASNASIEVMTATTPVQYQLEQTDHHPDQFVKDNYVDCLR